MPVSNAKLFSKNKIKYIGTNDGQSYKIILIVFSIDIKMVRNCIQKKIPITTSVIGFVARPRFEL